MRGRSPATIVLRRAQLILVLAALVPTVLITAVGVVLLVTGGHRSVALVGGILTVAFCSTALTGYILGSIFLNRGASLASVQNEFLAAVSHEIRTPLTSIRLFIDTLREERVTDPAEKRRCLTVVHEELSRLDGLVGKLIELSKIESGRAVFENKPVELRDVVNEALQAFEAARVGSEVNLTVESAPGLRVNGDRGALARAVANLLVNAWKYTPAHDRRITLTTHADARHVLIDVRDNGPGIPRDEQQTIFDKFQRGSTGNYATGSGLGLAIVRATVTSHRGSVQVLSEPAQGACFRITLPRLRDDVR